MDAMRNYFAGITLLVLCSLMGNVQAQNVYRDYVSDQNAQYSPFDHQQRGLIYKMHTGHAGFFGDCDDDRQKMVSPYIDWHCRKPECHLGIRFVNEIFTDMFRKNQRFTDGAGACVLGRCNNCNGTAGECNCDEMSVANKRPVRYAHRNASQQNHSATTTARTNQPTNLNRIDPRQPTTHHSYTGSASDSTYQSTAYSASQMNVTRGTSIFDRENNRTQQYGNTNVGQKKPVRSSQPYSKQQYASSRTKSNNSLYSSINPYQPLDERVRSNSNQRSIYQSSNRQTAGQQPVGQSQNRIAQTQYHAPRTTSREPVRTSQHFENRSQVGQSKLGQSPRVPENKFQPFEKTVRPRENQSNSRQRSPFKLSSGSVYDRPQFQKQETSSKEPVQDQKSDPRYFQFQRIGGSTYR